MISINIPPYAAAVVDVLRQNGYEAYIVGGCVRDALLGRGPNDWDVTTAAPPDKTIEIFSALSDFHAVPTGIAHGTVTVVYGGVPVEVTTYRIDGAYTDSRHPDSVEFTGDLCADLARRDFTINAMAYAPSGGLVDPYGGVRDLEARLIRCVGDPKQRFSEDALRIMRALRFAAQLGFDIQSDTANAAAELVDSLADISKERITDELSKLLLGHDAARVMREHARMFSRILLIFTEDAVVKASERICRLCGASLPLMLAALLADLSSDDACEFFGNLRFEGKTAKIAKNILLHKGSVLFDKISVKRLCRDIGAEDTALVIRLKTALGENTESAGGYLEEIINANECYTVASLQINGRDLLALGYEPENIGKALDRLLDAVIREDIPNDKETLLKTAALFLKEMP